MLQKKKNYNFLLDSHLSCPHAGDNLFVKKGILKSPLLLCLETHPASVWSCRYTRKEWLQNSWKQYSLQLLTTFYQTWIIFTVDISVCNRCKTVQRSKTNKHNNFVLCRKLSLAYKCMLVKQLEQRWKMKKNDYILKRWAADPAAESCDGLRPPQRRTG